MQLATDSSLLTSASPLHSEKANRCSRSRDTLCSAQARVSPLGDRTEDETLQPGPPPSLSSETHEQLLATAPALFFSLLPPA